MSKLIRLSCQCASGCIQERPAIGGRGFIDFSKRDRTNQQAITLNEYEIGGQHKIRTPEHLADATVASPSSHANTALDSA